MSDTPFLIAHKVRGEPAFDIAIKMSCPLCVERHNAPLGCDECDGQGYWWICSTSGHRAYPFAHWDAMRLCLLQDGPEIYPSDEIKRYDPAFIAALPDHYRVNVAPRAKVADIGRSLLASLGLTKPNAPIKRRI